VIIIVGGLDPSGRSNSEGIQALTMNLKNTMSMKTLKLADNRLNDEDMMYICDALYSMPNFQDLDVSSNLFTFDGSQYLKNAILSHSVFETDE